MRPPRFVTAAVLRAMLRLLIVPAVAAFFVFAVIFSRNGLF